MTDTAPRRDVDLRAAEQGSGADPSGLIVNPRLSLEDLAQMADMTPRNVRAYQQRRMLPPGRREGRRLVYDWDHVARLRLIRALHSRGLSLQVIENLIARGAAEDELARIHSEGTPRWERVRVPVGEATIGLLNQGEHTVKDLLEAGVVHLEEGQLVASSAALGVAGALLGQGVGLESICRVVLVASCAARDAADQLDGRPLAGLDASTTALLARLAATIFSEQLLDETERRRGPATVTVPAAVPARPAAAPPHG